MKIVIFGLTVSSSWGNGHATLWRGLCHGLAASGHYVVFFERDVPYYAAHRDLFSLPGGELRLFDTWENIRSEAAHQVSDADVAILTSYCFDGAAATELVIASSVNLRVFYDLDTPVTLSRLSRGETVPYLGTRGLGDFDLVLSYTGGRALEELRTQLGARQVAPLYGSVDPDVHRPVTSDPALAADFSYLGTYAEDRQTALETLFVDPARRLPEKRFLIGGAQYPQHFPWTENIFFVYHVEPSRHPAFFCSSPLTLNITRGAMKAMGYCPSGRLFEAAACGTAIISDRWEGLDQFFQPGNEIVVADSADDVIEALSMDRTELTRMARRARDRVLGEHTAVHRARELVQLLENALGGHLAAAVPGEI